MTRAALTEYVETLSTVSSGYDTENIFSPEGRIYQMEYAREAGYRGKTVEETKYSTIPSHHQIGDKN